MLALAFVEMWCLLYVEMSFGIALVHDAYACDDPYHIIFLSPTLFAACTGSSYMQASAGSGHVQTAADCTGGGVQVAAGMSDDILSQWRLRRKLEQARGEAASFHSLPLHGVYRHQPCSPAPSHACKATSPQCPCCGGGGHHRSVGQGGGAGVSCGFGVDPQPSTGQGSGTVSGQCRGSQQHHASSSTQAESGAGVLCRCGGGRSQQQPSSSAQGSGTVSGEERVRILKEQEVQTSPGLLAGEQGHNLPPVGDSGAEQGGTELRPRYEESADHTPQEHLSAGTTPPRETSSTVRQEQGFGATPIPAGEPSERAPPTHGGLALRDLTLSEDTQFTMTFNTETSLDTSTCNEHMSTPTPHHRHDNMEQNNEGTPPVLNAALSPPGLEAGMMNTCL